MNDLTAYFFAAYDGHGGCRSGRRICKDRGRMWQGHTKEHAPCFWYSCSDKILRKLMFPRERTNIEELKFAYLRWFILVMPVQTKPTYGAMVEKVLHLQIILYLLFIKLRLYARNSNNFL